MKPKRLSFQRCFLKSIHRLHNKSVGFLCFFGQSVVSYHNVLQEEMLSTQVWWIICQHHMPWYFWKCSSHTHSCFTLSCRQNPHKLCVRKHQLVTLPKCIHLTPYSVTVFPIWEPGINGFPSVDAETVNSCEPVGKGFWGQPSDPFHWDRCYLARGRRMLIA